MTRGRIGGSLLAAILAAAVLLRVAAALVLSPTIESDGLAYVTMARSLVADGVLRDQWGQHAFYSAGYPLLLAPAFALAGSGLATVVAVNCALAVVTGLLAHRLVLALGGTRGAALVAAAIFAAWLPSVWNATLPAKENLSTPLLLGLVLCALAVARGARWTAGLGAGLCWGAGAVTGGSALLTGAALALALAFVWRQAGLAQAGRALLAFALGALLTLGPWLIASDRMVGEPLLSTNAEFNVYLGNNPAADGRFVSIAQTSAGPRWEALRLALGEAGASHWLGGLAREWIAANPGAAARLALVKLGLFWAPNWPDAADFAASKAIATIRLADVAQYLLVLAAAALGLASGPIPPRDRLVVGAAVAGFWLIHAAAYVMPRYRDPIAPLLIALAACWAWPIVSRILIQRPVHAA